ncbi:MAG: helix-turn-helix transcriptional regulator [Bacteroidales bacterium]|nr:helix-turn-helix transcriptional regulator [Bacteroidales bacterium]
MRTIIRSSEFDEFYNSLPANVQNKVKHLPTTEDMFVDEYGAKGTASRDEFDAKSRAWYYAEVLKNARKSAGITQQQLADKIGKKREYVAMLEKGETDMQLSTFIMISEAVSLKFALTY